MADTAFLIDHFFDRLANALPTYIPALPSMIKSLQITSVIGLLGLVPISRLTYDAVKSGGDAMKYIQAIVMTAVVVVATSTIFDVLQDKLYMMEMIRENKQHFANLFWLKRYRTAIL